MTIQRTILLAGIALAGLSAAPAFAAKYTCDDKNPCIVKAEEHGKRRVDLTWSGKGTSYDFYKIIVRNHGGGKAREFVMKGGKKGHGRIDLKKQGDYEITVAGCLKKGANGQPDCKPSSEKVRLNLR